MKINNLKNESNPKRIALLTLIMFLCIYFISFVLANGGLPPGLCYYLSPLVNASGVYYNNYSCGNNTDNVCPSDFEYLCYIPGQGTTFCPILCGEGNCARDLDCGSLPLQCNLTSATITPNCRGIPGNTQGCDVGDNITVTATFAGNCQEVKALETKIKDTNCELSLEIPCTVSSSGSCSGVATIRVVPDGCENKIVYLRNATAWNETLAGAGQVRMVVTYNDTQQHLNGGFKFSEKILKFIDLIIWPPSALIQVGNLFEWNLTAVFFNQTSGENVTKYVANDDPHSQFFYSNPNVAHHPGSPYPNRISKGFSAGETNVVGTWPWPWNYKQDTALLKVINPTGCVISLAAIIPYCRPGGCNVSDKINLNVKVNSPSCDPDSNPSRIVMKGHDSSLLCNVELSVDGIYCDGLGNCNKNYTINSISDDCAGKTVMIKVTELYNATGPLASLQGNFGSFQFWAPAPEEPSYITLWPRDWHAKVGDSVSYDVWAHYPTNPPKNVTTDEYTNYSSSNNVVAYQISPKNVFYGNSTGTTTITARYPKGYNYAKENSTSLYVYPHTDCEILDANMSFNCDDSIGGIPQCNNGDTIDLGVVVNQQCYNLNIAKIQMRAHEKFNQANHGSCSFDMNASFTQQACSYNDGNYFCHGTWTVGVPSGCEGKNVIVDGVIVYNYSGNFLDSRQGYIGNFSFVETPQSLRAIIVTPNEGATFNLSENPVANFTQASIGQITNWTWLYRKITIPQSPWTVLRSTSNPNEANITNYDFSYYGWKGGNYDINLTVSNLSLSDDDIVEITLIDNYTPIANITRPLWHVILYNNSVVFDSECFDPNNNPLNVTWYFDDNTNVSGPYLQFKNVTHIFGQAKPNFFRAWLNVTDGQNSSVDYVEFKIAYCYHNNNYYFAGSCIGQNNLYCNKNDCNEFGECNVVADCRKCNNCPSSYYCDGMTGNCSQGPGPQGCQQYDQQQCNAQIGCYWDACKACNDPQKPIRSCSDYTRPSACNNDSTNCQVGMPNHGLGTEICDTLIETPPGSGNYSLVNNCHCEWNSNINNCTLAYTLIPQNQNGGGQPQPEDCQYQIIAEDCGSCQVSGREGRNVSYKRVFGDPNVCVDRSWCQPCGLLFRPLPFFEWWQAIVVVGLVVVVYAFMLRRKYL
ncbi:MAG: hypothetical protein QW484_02920 [Candidatus Pacearchaeota archaeon]